MTMRAFTGIILSSLLCTAAFAQSTDAAPTFEIGDVHTSPYRAVPFMDGGYLRGDRYVLRQATMVDLTATAYGVGLEKRTSAAKAVKRRPFYGTAEPVPFVRQSLPQRLQVSEGFMCWPN